MSGIVDVLLFFGGTKSEIWGEEKDGGNSLMNFPRLFLLVCRADGCSRRTGAVPAAPRTPRSTVVRPSQSRRRGVAGRRAEGVAVVLLGKERAVGDQCNPTI